MFEYDYIPKAQVIDPFEQACKSGDLNFIKNFYKQPKFNIFKRFLSLFESSSRKITSPPDSPEYKGFVQACINGHEDIVKFILNHSNHLGEDCIVEGFFKGLSDGRLNAIKQLAPHLNKEEILFDYYALRTFNELCKDGNLNAIKYFLTDKVVNISLDNIFNGTTNGIECPNEGFVSACRNDDLELIRYLTSSSDLPIHVDVNNVTHPFFVRNPEIIKYFIIDLNVKATDKLIEKIYFEDTQFIKDLFQKRDHYNELSSSLRHQDENITSKKKQLKI